MSQMFLDSLPCFALVLCNSSSLYHVLEVYISLSRHEHGAKWTKGKYERQNWPSWGTELCEIHNMLKEIAMYWKISEDVTERMGEEDMQATLATGRRIVARQNRIRRDNFEIYIGIWLLNGWRKEEEILDLLRFITICITLLFYGAELLAKRVNRFTALYGTWMLTDMFTMVIPLWTCPRMLKSILIFSHMSSRLQTVLVTSCFCPQKPVICPTNLILLAFIMLKIIHF